jgi:hypothetical protein
MDVDTWRVTVSLKDQIPGTSFQYDWDCNSSVKVTYTLVQGLVISETAV